MTNKQAIELLKWFGEYNDIDYHGGDMIENDKGDRFYRVVKEDLEAFDMAIKALSQQTEDAISRQAVLDIVNNPLNIRLDEIIKKLPSVKPQEPSDISNDGTLTVNVEDGRKITRVLVCGANHWGGLYYPDEQGLKIGHWKISGDSMKCSVCGAWVENHAPRNFCGHCGAKMESEV